ncbi:MAG: TetR family transcriptional regulator [Hyphomicrobiales bacterium]|nr:TetR family transcriptional regulator [Hyphomicrobiales bacterium]
MDKNEPFPASSFLGAARRGYHHGRLKDALVEAARSLLAERGAAGFTLAEAAKRVGVTAAAPYRHFVDRNALMAELARQGFDSFGQRLSTAWKGGQPRAFEALARMGTAYLTFAREEPGLYAAMFENVSVLAAPESGAAADKALAILRQAAAAVLKEAGGSEDGAKRLAFEIWALSHGVAMLAAGGHLDPRNPGCDPAAILNGGVDGLVSTAIRMGHGQR